MKKEIIAGAILVVCILVLIVLVQRQEAKKVRAEVERDMVYCIASKNYCSSGIFNLYTIKDGSTIIEIRNNKYPKVVFTGAGSDSLQTKEGKKK